MQEPPDGQETWESYLGERRPPSDNRLLKRHLALERKHTEKLFDGLYRAIKTEMGRMEQRTAARLDEIDASVSLIAIELARRAEDPPSSEAST